jgi:zinc ribbon protein
VEPPANLACTNCGTNAVQGAEFCANCGARLPAAPAETPPVGLLTTTPSPATESAFRVLGYFAAIISATVLGLLLSVVVGGTAMSLSLQSKVASVAIAVALLAVVALLVVLIVRVARGKVGSSRTLSAFLVTFAVVFGSGLSVCSGIAFLPLFGK